MATSGLRIGIAGCGPAAIAHARRLMAVDGVSIVGCWDVDASAARSFSRLVSGPDREVPCFGGHAELIREASPDALAIFTPPHSPYKPAMDALQAGCHVLLEAPLSTSVQEAVDIAGLARGRARTVGVCHPFRLLPSLVRAREMLAGGAIGPVRLVTATLAGPGPYDRAGDEDSRQSDDRPAGGLLADSGAHLVDALLWTLGRSADLVGAIRSTAGIGEDEVTSATARLGEGTLATIAISGAWAAPSFELDYHGRLGRLRATDRSLTLEAGDGQARPVPLPEPSGDVEADFVAAVLGGSSPCCPADQAVEAVRLLEAIARSAAIGQFVGLA